MNTESNEKQEGWKIEFLNLPPKEQIQFLYRETLDYALRKELEEKVFGKSESDPSC